MTIKQTKNILSTFIVLFAISAMGFITCKVYSCILGLQILLVVMWVLIIAIFILERILYKKTFTN